jgi:hypothetical protein
MTEQRREDSDLQYLWDCPEFCRAIGNGGIVGVMLGLGQSESRRKPHDGS